MIRTDAPPRRFDGAVLAIAAFLAALGAILIWDAARLPDRGGYAGVGPADVPRLVGAVLVLLGVGTAVAAFRGAPDERPRQHLGPVVWIIGGLAAQIALLHTAGFIAATTLLFAGTAAGFGERRFHVILPAGLALTALVYLVFDRLLQLNLPGGPVERLIFGG